VKDLPEFIAVLSLLSGLMIGIAAHEAGHFLCALVGSIPVRLFSIGVGPLLLRTRVAETTLEFRLLPVSGFVMSYPLGKERTRWRLLFVLGGFIGNTAVIVCLTWLHSVDALPRIVRDNVGPVVFAQLWLIAFNMLPFGLRIDGQEVVSDGWQLLRLLRGRLAGTAAIDRDGR
jgi:hypothetical protein